MDTFNSVINYQIGVYLTLANGYGPFADRQGYISFFLKNEFCVLFTRFQVYFPIIRGLFLREFVLIYDENNLCKLPFRNSKGSLLLTIRLDGKMVRAWANTLHNHLFPQCSYATSKFLANFKSNPFIWKFDKEGTTKHVDLLSTETLKEERMAFCIFFFCKMPRSYVSWFNSTFFNLKWVTC